MGQYEAHRKRSQEPPEGETPHPPRRRRKRRRRRSPVGLILLCLVLVAGIAAGAGYFWYTGEVNGSRIQKESVEVEIPQGSGTAGIASILEEAGAIGNAQVFRFYSKYVAKADGTYQYGTFTLSPGEGYDSIIDDLQEVQQQLETVTLTFPEGYNAFQMGDVLEKAGLWTREEFITALNEHEFDLDFLDEVGSDPLKLVRLDGFLFPDTYEFYADEDVDSVILRMLRNFENRICTSENQ